MPQWAHFFRTTLDLANADSIEPGGALLFWTAMEALRWIVPILGAGIAVSLISREWLKADSFLRRKLWHSSLNGLALPDRLKQLVSLARLSTILKSLLPFSAIAWVGVASIRGHWAEITTSTAVDVRGFVHLIGGILLELCWKSGLILLIWAGVDFMLLWWKNEGDLKMSRQDIRDELRQTEGNPESKAQSEETAEAEPPQADAEGRGDCHSGDYEPDALCGRSALRSEYEGANRGGQGLG